MLLSDTTGYAEPLSALHTACFENGWSVAEFQSLLALPTTVCWITDTSFLLCSHVVDEMEILTVGVVPSARKQGGGMRLLTALFDYAKTNGVHHIFLEVAVTNTAAMTLYEKAGFIPTGRRPNYYTTPTGAVDALCLTKTL